MLIPYIVKLIWLIKYVHKIIFDKVSGSSEELTYVYNIKIINAPIKPLEAINAFVNDSKTSMIFKTLASYRKIKFYKFISSQIKK